MMTMNFKGIDMEENNNLLLSLKEIEVTKLNLKPGDVLAISIKSDEIDGESLKSLKISLGKLFPNNKVAVFGFKPEDGIEFSVIANSEPKGYCDDCSCGKKE